MKKLPLYVALDMDDKKQAFSLAQKIAPYVTGFKIGPRFLIRYGPSLINQLKIYGKVFLDLKFFDIPSTMLSAVKSAFDQGADMVTIHAGAGESALKHLADLEIRLNTKRPFRILAVTVLTSFERKTLPPLVRVYTVSAHVKSLSDMVIKSGLKGLVCSGHEVKHLRQKYPSAYLLTPGVRMGLCIESKTNSHVRGPGSLLSTPSHHDQKRVISPRQALQAGANALVMGRPIYQSKDPLGVSVHLQKELADLL